MYLCRKVFVVVVFITRHRILGGRNEAKLYPIFQNTYAASIMHIISAVILLMLLSVQKCVSVCFLGKVWVHDHLSGYFPYIEPNLQSALNNSPV